MAISPDEHRCYRGSRCVDAERTENTRRGRLIVAAAGLCPSCERVTETAIRELPADYVQLHRMIGKVKRVGSDLVSGSRELPVPLALDVEALLAEIVHESTCWAESVSEVIGADVDTQSLRGYRDAVLVQFAAEHLADHLTVFLALRDVVHLGWADGQRTTTERHGHEGAIALLALHHRVRSYTGQTRLTHRLPAPCPRCERLTLQRHDGDDLVECATCAHRMTWDTYGSLCNILTGGVA